MQNSSVLTPSSIVGKPLSLADINTSLVTSGGGSLSPFDQCRLLVLAADAYYNVTGKEGGPEVVVQEQPSTGLWGDAMDQLCAIDKCVASGIKGMCKLCDNFVNALGVHTAATAAASCTGYDFSDKVSLKSVIDIAEEVVDITRSSNLYLLNVGFQR